MALETWDTNKRLQFIIAPTTVSGAITIPFIFKISANTGRFDRDLNYVFMALGGQASVANRKKIIFSQVVCGEEQPLYCELDIWNAVSNTAYFWVRPKELSSTHSNIFYMYFDANHENNTLYLSETNETSLSLFRDLSVEGTYDTYHILPGEVLKVGDKYQMWPLGHNGSKWGILYCESTDLVTWTNHALAFDWSHSHDSAGHHSGTVMYDEGTYRMWYSGLTGSNWEISYCDSLDGVVWSNHTLAIPRGKTAYSNYHTLRCAVLKEGNTYKMWYCGYENSVNGSVIYCESPNGINWYNHQMIVHYTDIPEVNINVVRPSKVVFEEGKYIMHSDIHNGSFWRGYYMDSVDGINWENHSILANINTLGTYDTTNAGWGPFHIKVGGLYYIFYGVYNTKWRIALSKSVSLKAFRTPSQEVWGDDFFSIHHLNSTYGYIDSTSNRLNVESTNNILPVVSNIGNSAVELFSNESYVNFGNSDAYDFTKSTCIYVFGKYFSGNTILSKGTLGESSFNLYYLSEVLSKENVNDIFTDTDGSYPDTLLWTSNNYLTILGNRLHVNLIPSDTAPGNGQNIKTKWHLRGDFDVEVDFESVTLDNTSENSKMIYLTAYSVSDSSAYFFLGIGINSGIKYWTRVQTPGSSCCNDTTIARNFSEGSIRLKRVGTTCYLYYKDTSTSDSWVQARTATWCDHDTLIYLQSYRSSTNYDIDGYFDNFKVTGTVLWPFNSTEENSLNLDIFDTEEILQNIYLKDTVPENLWLSTIVAKLTGTGVNTLFRHNLTTPLDSGLDTTVGNLNYTTQPLYLGSSTGSVLGQVAEVWFSNNENILTTDTLTFIDKVLKDNVVEISNCYVQGYATAYGKAQYTKILAYNKETKLLIGYAETDPETGYYYVEVPNQEECYLIGLDGGLYNHYILGKIFPYLV